MMEYFPVALLMISASLWIYLTPARNGWYGLIFFFCLGVLNEILKIHVSNEMVRLAIMLILLFMGASVRIKPSKKKRNNSELK